MAATQKIVLNPSRDIPFNKLVLSQANVRRVKAGVSIEALAESIARRSLLQSLSVRPVLDAEGNETGTFEVPAGGRRFRALELLVRQKRLAKTAPIPCIVKTEGLAEEDSLAENTDREALHPLDQFRAFQTLRAKGQGEEEIAAAFGVTAAVVRQRLKLAAASPVLLDAYAEGAMTLDQLMAFCVSDDHARQEQVWATIQRGWNKEPHIIRRMLTEGAVRASDRRARFVGTEAYEAAGGIVMRDLFQDDDGGWFQDPALLDRLVAEQPGARGRRHPRRGLEMGRGRAGLPLRPPARAASAAGHQSADRGGAGGVRCAEGRIRRARGAVWRGRRTARGGRGTTGRDRSGDRGIPEPPAEIRSRRHRPRRRLRQHRP